jgi:collagen type III alpha
MMGQQLQYHQGIHAATKNLAMANISGGGSGTPTPGDPPFNQGPGQQPFPGPQNNRLGQNKPMGMMPPPSPAGGPPKEQPKDVKPGLNGAEGSPRNQQPPNPATGGQGPPNQSGGGQVNTAPPTPSATSSSITAPSPSAVNGTPTINPATQPTTSLPEVPASFLTNEFMQSVANTLDEFDTQSLFRPEEGINFEQDFREWFNPLTDDLDMK